MTQKTSKKKIYHILSQENIDKVEVAFSGAGDEGFFDEPLFLKNGKVVSLPKSILTEKNPKLATMTSIQYGPQLPKKGKPIFEPCNLQEAIESIAYEHLKEKHPGWENGAGASGCLNLYPKLQSFHLEFQKERIQNIY